MEWVLGNWDVLLGAAGVLFYVAEKIVKENKRTGWNDILVDGLKWLAGRGPKKLIVVFLLLPFIGACTSAPVHLKQECADSYLVKNYEYYQTGALVVKIGNITALRNQIYTKEQAMAVFDEIEEMLKTRTVTYAQLAAFALVKVKWVNEHAGVEIFILADFLLAMEANVEVIGWCDAEILLKDIAKLKLYTGML